MIRFGSFCEREAAEWGVGSKREGSGPSLFYRTAVVFGRGEEDPPLLKGGEVTQGISGNYPNILLFPIKSQTSYKRLIL